MFIKILSQLSSKVFSVTKWTRRNHDVSTFYRCSNSNNQVISQILELLSLISLQYKNCTAQTKPLKRTYNWYPRSIDEMLLIVFQVFLSELSPNLRAIPVFVLDRIIILLIAAVSCRRLTSSKSYLYSARCFCLVRCYWQSAVSLSPQQRFTMQRFYLVCCWMIWSHRISKPSVAFQIDIVVSPTPSSISLSTGNPDDVRSTTDFVKAFKAITNAGADIEIEPSDIYYITSIGFLRDIFTWNKYCQMKYCQMKCL